MFVASDEFVEAAEAQGKALGFAPAAHFVPHPIQGESDAAIQTLAYAAAQPITAQLLSDGGEAQA